jgi:hypothetical protein
MVFCYAICQDPEVPNLLFVGTEFGLYVSIDAGKNWSKWKAGFPTVPTMDLTIQTREADLAIATFGRALYVLDDIRPLRAIAKEGVGVLDKPIKVFAAPTAYQAIYRQPMGKHDFQTDNLFQGENRAKGVKVEVLDAGRKLIRSFKTGAKTGVNRIYWNLDQKNVRFPSSPKPKADAPESGGMDILPGNYTVKIGYGEAKDSTIVTVKADPRSPITDAERKARYDLMLDATKRINVVTAAADRIREAQAKIGMVNTQFGTREDDKVKAAKKLGKDAQDKLKSLMNTLIPDPDVQGIIRSPKVISGILGNAFGYLQTVEGMPGSTEVYVLKNMDEAIKAALVPINAFFGKEWPAYQKAVTDAEPKIFEEYKPLKMD